MGTRLVYTAAAVLFFGDGVQAAYLVLMAISCAQVVLLDARAVGNLVRNTRRSTEEGASNVLALLFDIIYGLEVALDVGRHVAVLYLASDGTTAVRTIGASVGGRQLALTNVAVRSATFTASVVLKLQTVWVSARSRDCRDCHSAQHSHECRRCNLSGPQPVSIDAACKQHSGAAREARLHVPWSLSDFWNFRT